jgi:hypothetical protein
MIPMTRPLLLAAALAATAQAQEAHLGLAFGLLMPTGTLRSTTYGPTTTVPVPQTEGYDLGLGAQFTASFPLDQRTAIRLNVNGHSSTGTNVAPGYTTLNLEHSIFSVGAEMQFFSGSAYRHRGAYLFAGLSADFESFDRSSGDVGWDNTATTRKSRSGASLGVGRTFGYEGGYRFTVELAYHKTLSGTDAARLDPPSSDFFKMNFGWVF